MDAVLGSLFALAVVALAGAGLATIAGAHVLRDRMLGWCVVLVVLALAAQVLAGFVRNAFSSEFPGQRSGHALPHSSGKGGVSRPLLFAFVFGHAVLGVALARRIRQRSGGSRHGLAELQAARGRLRPRIGEQVVDPGRTE